MTAESKLSIRGVVAGFVLALASQPLLAEPTSEKPNYGWGGYPFYDAGFDFYDAGFDFYDAGVGTRGPRHPISCLNPECTRYGPPIVGYKLVPVYGPSVHMAHGFPQGNPAPSDQGAEQRAGPPQPIICLVAATHATEDDSGGGDIAVIAQTNEACSAIGGKVTSVAGKPAKPAAEGSGETTDSDG